MKRFTDTEKWQDPWFRALKPKMKCLWNYMCDRCDASGVWKPDFELASFCIGEPITEQEALAIYASRIQVLASGWWIIKFIEFQIGELMPECRPHQAILRLINTHRIPYRKGIGTLQEKDKEKEQEKDQDPEGDSKGGRDLTLQLKIEVGKHFNRKLDGTWSYDEEFALCAVARRPEALEEWSEILSYRQATRKDGFGRQTVRSLLENWPGELDKARNYVPLNGTLPPIRLKIYSDELALNRQSLADLRASYDGHSTWKPADLDKRRRLEARQRELEKILGMQLS